MQPLVTLYFCQIQMLVLCNFHLPKIFHDQQCLIYQLLLYALHVCQNLLIRQINLIYLILIPRPKLGDLKNEVMQTKLFWSQMNTTVSYNPTKIKNKTSIQWEFHAHSNAVLSRVAVCHSESYTLCCQAFAMAFFSLSQAQEYLVSHT